MGNALGRHKRNVSLTVIVVVIVLVYASLRSETEVAGRLSRLMDPGSPVKMRKGFFGRSRKSACAKSWLLSGNFCRLPPGKQATRAQLMMIRAGYRSPDAMLVIRGLESVAADCCVSLVVAFTGLIQVQPVFILLGARSQSGSCCRRCGCIVADQGSPGASAPGAAGRSGSARDLRGSGLGPGSGPPESGAGIAHCASGIERRIADGESGNARG